MKLPAIVNEKLLTRAMLGVGVYFAIVKPLLVKLNIQDSKDEKLAKAKDEATKLVVDSGSSESPYSWAAFFAKAPKFPDVTLMNNAATTKRAKIFHDAWNYWNFMNQYDEDLAFGVLDGLKTQSEFAWICKKFFEMYSTSLHTYLKSVLRDEEFKNFNLKLVQKPRYK